MRPICCIVPQHVFNFATLQKRWANLGASGWLVPRFALDVQKSPSLRASVGGGQISLTSVLIGGFVHVLLCLFALPAPLVCSGPEHFFSVSGSVAQKVPSGDATLNARAVPCQKNVGFSGSECGSRGHSRLHYQRLPHLSQWLQFAPWILCFRFWRISSIWRWPSSLVWRSSNSGG